DEHTIRQTTTGEELGTAVDSSNSFQDCSSREIWTGRIFELRSNRRRCGRDRLKGAAGEPGIPSSPGPLMKPTPTPSLARPLKPVAVCAWCNKVRDTNNCWHP